MFLENQVSRKLLMKGINMRYVIFMIVLFMHVSLNASNKYNDYFSKLESNWIANSIDIENYSYMYEYGNVNEHVKLDIQLQIKPFGESALVLDRKLYFDSEESDSRTFSENLVAKRFFENNSNLYETNLEFIDYEISIDKAIYRRFIFPVLTETTSDIYDKDRLITEAFAVLHLSGNSVLSGPYSLTLPNLLTCDGSAENILTLSLVDETLKYKRAFKGIGYSSAVYAESVSYKRSQQQIAKNDYNINFEETLFLTLCKKFHSETSEVDFKRAYDEILLGKKNEYSDIYQMLSDVKSFISSLAGTWSDGKKVGYAISKNGVILCVNFEYDTRLVYDDYVLENRVTEFSPYTKDEYYSYPKSMRDKLTYSCKNIPLGSIESYIVKPMMFMFFNAKESRLYLCRMNELSEYSDNKVYITLYSSFYYIDIRPNQKIPSTIKWKTDYSRYYERNKIKKPKRIIWEVSNDYTQINEYVGDDRDVQKVFILGENSL